MAGDWTIIKVDGKIKTVVDPGGHATQDINIMGTTFRIMRHCSEETKNTFMQFQQKQDGEVNEVQVGILASIFYAEYYEPDASWDVFDDDDTDAWDGAVKRLLEHSYDRPFPFIIQVL